MEVLHQRWAACTDRQRIVGVIDLDALIGCEAAVSGRDPMLVQLRLFEI
jgi:hypothetical protein